MTDTDKKAIELLAQLEKFKDAKANDRTKRLEAAAVVAQLHAWLEPKLHAEAPIADEVWAAIPPHARGLAFSGMLHIFDAVLVDRG